MTMMNIDFVILICNGCKSERKMVCDPIIRGVEDVKRWIDTQPTQCGCGAKTCDLKMHIMEQN